MPIPAVEDRMNIRRISIATTILVLLPYTIVIKADNFGQAKSLFSDIKAHTVGDIPTDNIYENLQAKMSVILIAVRNIGYLVIEGSRTVGISTDKETLDLTGMVRQRDLKADNSFPIPGIRPSEGVGAFW